MLKPQQSLLELTIFGSYFGRLLPPLLLPTIPIASPLSGLLISTTSRPWSVADHQNPLELMAVDGEPLLRSSSPQSILPPPTTFPNPRHCPSCCYAKFPFRQPRQCWTCRVGACWTQHGQGHSRSAHLPI